MSDYVIPDRNPRRSTRSSSMELRHLAANAVLKGQPVRRREVRELPYYLEPTADLSYCWHPKLRILVGAEWWCQWWTPSPKSRREGHGLRGRQSRPAPVPHRRRATRRCSPTVRRASRSTSSRSRPTTSPTRCSATPCATGTSSPPRPGGAGFRLGLRRGRRSTREGVEVGTPSTATSRCRPSSSSTRRRARSGASSMSPPHRPPMAAAYSRYAVVEHAPLPRRPRSAQMVLWPFFLTSFLLDDLLADNAISAPRS